MGKCYCDYCDVFLTHDSASVRKQHNDGNRHRQNVCEYYRQHITRSTQEKIDEIVADFEKRVARNLVIPTYGISKVYGAQAHKEAVRNSGIGVKRKFGPSEDCEGEGVSPAKRLSKDAVGAHSSEPWKKEVATEESGPTSEVSCVPLEVVQNSKEIAGEGNGSGVARPSGKESGDVIRKHGVDGTTEMPNGKENDITRLREGTSSDADGKRGTSIEAGYIVKEDGCGAAGTGGGWNKAPGADTVAEVEADAVTVNMGEKKERGDKGDASGEKDKKDGVSHASADGTVGDQRVLTDMAEEGSDMEMD